MRSTLPCDICEDDFGTEEIKLIGAVKAALLDELKTSDKCETETQTKEIVSEESVSTESTPVDDTFIASTCISEGIIEVTDTDGESKRLLTCDKGHLLAIETEFVLSAVKEFVERCEFVKREISLDKATIKEKITVSRNITERDIIDFWERYRNIFSKDKEKLWDNLLVGLKQYYEVLKERHKLNAEIKALRKQNTEMRRLLSGNIPEPEIMQIGRAHV